MSQDYYADLLRRLPRSIQFPNEMRLDGRFPDLAEVRKVQDLPPRLIFGDLIKDSFTLTGENWSAEFKDELGSVSLWVRNNRFLATLRFLGQSLVTCGPLHQRELIISALDGPHPTFHEGLRKHLGFVPGLAIPEWDAEWPASFFLPDGWAYTILVPIPTSRLQDLLRVHCEFNAEGVNRCPVEGRADLVQNIVEYGPGCAPAVREPLDFVTRAMRQCQVPQPRHVGQWSLATGEITWEVKRRTYLYRCHCYLQDVPRIVKRLNDAKLLSDAPEMCGAIVPAEKAFGAEPLSWISKCGRARIDWIFEGQAAQMKLPRSTHTRSAALVNMAAIAWRTWVRFAKRPNSLERPSLPWTAQPKTLVQCFESDEGTELTMNVATQNVGESA